MDVYDGVFVVVEEGLLFYRSLVDDNRLPAPGREYEPASIFQVYDL